MVGGGRFDERYEDRFMGGGDRFDERNGDRATVGSCGLSRKKTFGMKTRVILLMALCCVACRRSTLIPHPYPGITGTVVENPGCGHFVVKILSGSYPDSSVESSWTDTVTKTTFTNVFTVGNFVQMQQAQLAPGDTFGFTLNGPVPEGIYNTCAIWPYNMPTATNNVTNIVKLP